MRNSLANIVGLRSHKCMNEIPFQTLRNSFGISSLLVPQYALYPSSHKDISDHLKWGREMKKKVYAHTPVWENHLTCLFKNGPYSGCRF